MHHNDSTRPREGQGDSTPVGRTPSLEQALTTMAPRGHYRGFSFGLLIQAVAGRDYLRYLADGRDDELGRAARVVVDALMSGMVVVRREGEVAR